MARKRGGGYRPAKDFDPRRGRPSEGRSSRRSQQRSSHSQEPSQRQRDQAASTRGEQSQPAALSADVRPTLAPLQTPPHTLEGATVTRDDAITVQSFAELGLGANIVRALTELGAEQPRAIQAVTIPDAIAGHHVLGRAQTGSGKTIAFGAALVERLLKLKAAGAFAADPPRKQLRRGEQSERRKVGDQSRPPKAIILAPTRELALQIDRTVQPIARSVGFFTAQLVGGQPFEPQLHALRRGADILIGTPGRIEDLVLRGHVQLGQVAVTVIDEADHLAELGFIDAVQRLLRRTRRGGQRLLFSATLDGRVDELVREFMPRPAIHEVVSAASMTGWRGGAGRELAGRELTGRSERGADTIGAVGAVGGYDIPETIEHRVVAVTHQHKNDAIVRLVRAGRRTLVFCRTRTYVDLVSELLTGAGVRVTSVHGNMAQAKRERQLERFAEGRVDVLVATDVAARGLHIGDIDLVLQADPPSDVKAYVHRAGRTGRTGARGTSVTLVAPSKRERMRELLEQLGIGDATFEDFAH